MAAKVRAAMPLDILIKPYLDFNHDEMAVYSKRVYSNGYHKVRDFASAQGMSDVDSKLLGSQFAQQARDKWHRIVSSA